VEDTNRAQRQAPGSHRRPPYAFLQDRPGFPPGSSWGLYGPDDEVGALNDIDAQAVVRAVGLVRRGQVFSLNWELTKPEPALFARGSVRHHHSDWGFGTDDYYDNFYPQASSQWDALAHFSHPEWGYYNGRKHEDLVGPHPCNGIDNWARRGIVTRYVLADVARWRAEQNRPLACDSREEVDINDVIATLDHFGLQPQLGDILLIRFGWIGWYESLAVSDREALGAAGEAVQTPGLKNDRRALAWLWDSGFVGVAADCPALEAFPFEAHSPDTLHAQGIALLGLAFGEMLDLERLAAASAIDGDYLGLLTAAPLNMPGGSGSPTNALAIR